MTPRTQICLPSMMPGGLDASMSDSFEEADVYNFLEVGGRDGEEFSLVHMRHSCHGAACVNPVDAISRRAVRALVVRRIADHTARLFEAEGTEVYVGASGSVLEAARRYAAGELNRALNPKPEP